MFGIRVLEAGEVTATSPKKPRRSPSQERSRQLVRDIEMAAAHVLAEHGYSGSSTARIADKTGVSVGSIYQYFRCKEAIFESLTTRLLSELLAAMQPAMATEGLSFGERTERICLAVLRVLAPYPSVLRQLAACPGANFYPRLHAAKLEAVERAKQLFALHASEVDIDDLDITARMLVDVGEGVVLNLRQDDDIVRVGREASRVFARYCAGDASAR